MLKLCELGGEGCEGKKPLGGSEKDKFEGKEERKEWADFWWLGIAFVAPPQIRINTTGKHEAIQKFFNY